MDRPTLTFARELVANLWDEVQPLLKAHYEEISAFPEIPLDPIKAEYLVLEAGGVLHCYTVRAAGALVGYAAFFVRRNMHYASSLQAWQDVLFIHPAHRGRGMRFVAWCDAQLFAAGVEVIYQHVKVAHDFGPALERIGYRVTDHLLARRRSGYAEDVQRFRKRRK